MIWQIVSLVGGLHGKDLSKADVAVNIYVFLKAQSENRTMELNCAIGDEVIDGKSYGDIVKFLNNPSILFHGSRLIKTYSKLENNSILILALNTGSNTFKANQLANIRYLFRRNKSYIRNGIKRRRKQRKWSL